MLLKQQSVIRTLAMYDEHPARCVIGVATDIAHIDTSPAVEAYQGRTLLKRALNVSYRRALRVRLFHINSLSNVVIEDFGTDRS